MAFSTVYQSPRAPKAIGPYSQAVKAGNFLFLSGQIGLDPATMELVPGDVKAQLEQIIKNIREVVTSAGGDLSSIVKLTLFLTNLADFGVVNETMKSYFYEPYPARSTIEVSALPKNALIEVEAIAVLES